MTVHLTDAERREWLVGKHILIEKDVAAARERFDFLESAKLTWRLDGIEIAINWHDNLSLKVTRAQARNEETPSDEQLKWRQFVADLSRLL